LTPVAEPPVGADHAVVYFEAGGEEVLITPVMPVRVLRSINSRLARRMTQQKNGETKIGRPPVRLSMLIPQGGAQPQNVAHYVNANPKPTPDGHVLNTGSRRSGYYALRARAAKGRNLSMSRRQKSAPL
jgi:hypothetical protein